MAAAPAAMTPADVQALYPGIEQPLSDLVGKIRFDPTESVTYNPNEGKQLVDMIVRNESSRPVIFKMKSTKPSVFKMRPVYSLVMGGEKKTVKLVFKGFKLGRHHASKKDHFTIVYSVAADEGAEPGKQWKSPANKPHFDRTGMFKKIIKIRYVGMNDQERDVPTNPEWIHEGAKPMPTSTEPSTKSFKPKDDPIIYLVYNKQEEVQEEVDEEENEDDDDEDVKSKAAPPAKKKKSNAV